nr:hypothetical protein BaRGS_019501 [Batillaria attramentaria]
MVEPTVESEPPQLTVCCVGAAVVVLKVLSRSASAAYLSLMAEKFVGALEAGVEPNLSRQQEVLGLTKQKGQNQGHPRDQSLSWLLRAVVQAPQLGLLVWERPPSQEQLLELVYCYD